MAVTAVDPQTLDQLRDINVDLAISATQPAINKANLRHHVIEVAGVENTETYATGIPNPVATAWQGGEAAAAVFIAASTAGLLTFTVEAGAGPFTGFAHIWAYE